MTNRKLGGGTANQMRALRYQVLPPNDPEDCTAWEVHCPGEDTVLLAKDEAEGWKLAEIHWYENAVRQSLAPMTNPKDMVEAAQAMVRHMIEGMPAEAVKDQAQTTIEFVQEWMMSGDHEPDKWHKDFAAAIDARHRLTAQAQGGDVEKQAPVGFLYEGVDGKPQFFPDRMFGHKNGHTETPLYAHPIAQAAGDVELRAVLQALSDCADEVSGQIDRETEDQRRELGPEWDVTQDFTVTLQWHQIRALNDAICQSQALLKDALSTPPPAPADERNDEWSTNQNGMTHAAGTDIVGVPRDVLAAACYIIRNSAHADSKTAQAMRRYSLAPAREDTYRGWKISQGRWPEPAWHATSPNYDASWEGEEDGWVDNGEKANGTTREALIAEIDAWFEEHGQ